MNPRAADSFEEWLKIPLLRETEDSRFLVRRARPEEFAEIYELVDRASGETRSRAEYDWLYRWNPGGIARCWVVCEKRSGRIVASGGTFPWPLALGQKRLNAYLLGDFVCAPGMQRQGLFSLLIRGGLQHPSDASAIKIASPNAKSRGAARKLGLGKGIIGPFSGGIRLLRSRAFLEALGWPSLLARAVGRPVDALLGAWHRASFRRPAQTRVEEIGRFGGEFDRVTSLCMSSSELFWCPHDSDFLNWRYVDHPANPYLRLAAFDGEEIVGYTVLRLDNEGSTLMELAGPPESPHVARDLLEAIITAAREAGSRSIFFFAPRHWRHWRLLHRAGFLPLPTGYYLYAGTGLHSQIDDLTANMSNWLVMPGDQDWI